MRKLVSLLLSTALVLAVPLMVSAAFFLPINSVWIQNASKPPTGTPGTSWWSTAPAAARSDIYSSGCAITCLAMVASDNVSPSGNPSSPYGVWLENGSSCSADWTGLANAFGIHRVGGFVELGGMSALDKAATLRALLQDNKYPIGKVSVPGERDHWVLFYGETEWAKSGKNYDPLTGGKVAPFTYDSPEEERMLPLEYNPPLLAAAVSAPTAYDTLFTIHDPAWISSTVGGPFINFHNNSKGATLDHLVRLVVMYR